MLGAGLEPARGLPLGCLRPLRLPFRHPSPDTIWQKSPDGALPLPFRTMIRILTGALIALVTAATTAAGQLPFLTGPAGTLRIELSGDFQPTNEEFADGERRGLGDPVNLDGALESGLGNRLADILGRPPSPISSGTLNASVMHQRATGTIGLAVAVTSRLTIGARLPIVSTRTESHLDFDGEGGNLGVNPTLQGNTTSADWLNQFGASLETLRARRDAGDYADDPARLALANQVLASAPGWHAAMTDLLVTTGTAATLLPLASSADGAELLAQATNYRDQLANELGVSAPGGAPALPAAAMTPETLATLLENPDGIGWAPVEEQPIVGLGDVELRATWALRTTRDVEQNRWMGAWLSAGATLPTGSPPRPDRLRDIGSGDGQLDLMLSGIAEIGRGRFGVRASAEWRMQRPGERNARVGSRDQFILPAASETLLQWDPGDMLSITALPFFRIADRLALTGSVQWLQRGADRWSPLEGFAGDPAAVAAMGNGTEASALIWGAGIGYIHDGSHVDGVSRMPVEAGLAIERVASSGSGLVAAPLTTRVWFRVYKSLW